MNAFLEHHNLLLVDSKDPIRGRYVKSTTRITKGTVIITSQPLGTVVLPQTANEYCNYCFRKQTQPPLQRCSRCKATYFCDMGCFRNAWLSYHQFVCTPVDRQEKTITAENDLDLEMLEKVALNVSRYRKRESKDETGGDEETVDVTMEAFFSLMGHDKLQRPAVQRAYRQIVQTALKKEYIRDTGLTEDELVHYLNVFKSNNFAIDDKDMFAIGEGTYPIASLFNHSCRPNAVIMYDGALAEIHAIEDIEPETEITVSYLDAAHSRTYRKRVLNDKYFFDCRCLRCEQHEEKPYVALIDELLGEEESEWDRADEILNGGKNETRSHVMKQIDEWDLLEMCKIYDRKSSGCPDPSEPISIAHFTHYFIQFFAPYLLTWNQPHLHQQYVGTTRKTQLTDFDDPLPALAKPPVQATYDDILSTAIETMKQYPTSSSTLIPYRLTTLSVCSRLMYDQMTEGHWEAAVKLGMYVLIQYCLIYPPYHPMLARHFLTLAKACWNSIIQQELLNNGRQLAKVFERGVRRWIMSSKETVAVAFGKHSSLWRETLELEWIFLREQNLK
ncbi:hypothetical protein RMCBS344292_06211 [Rhizopus microsporus]|nr:hypothetical protein RMCBS344292_06211 [Rhizopus microsporus]